MRFFDLHCDTMLIESEDILSDGNGQVSLKNLQLGDAWAQFFALFIRSHDQVKASESASPYERYLHLLSVYRREMDQQFQAILPALSVADFHRHKAAGKMSAVLAVEDAVALEGDIGHLEAMYEHGVRLLTLTWNYENELAYPHSPHAKRMALGLKPFGEAVVRRMNTLGMLIDVSHLSDGGVRDVARLSQKPFVASHSCARALCDHSRCLSDELLRLLGEKGCVIGLNFNPLFVRPGAHSITEEDLLAHALHIQNKAGIDALAFGSDFDGLMPGSVLSFGDYAGMPQLAATLERHFSPAQMDKICSGNVLRLLNDVWKGENV